MKRILILVVLFALLAAGIWILSCSASSVDSDGNDSADDSDDDDSSDDDDDAGDDDDDTTDLPPGAIEACEGKSEGDVCEIETAAGDTLSGICQMINNELGCVPDEPLDDDDDSPPPQDDDDSPPPPDDDDDTTGPPQEAIDACLDKAAGDDCSFENLGGKTVTGTCEMLGDVLACRPEGPPPE